MLQEQSYMWMEIAFSITAMWLLELLPTLPSTSLVLLVSKKNQNVPLFHINNHYLLLDSLFVNMAQATLTIGQGTTYGEVDMDLPLVLTAGSTLSISSNKLLECRRLSSTDGMYWWIYYFWLIVLMCYFKPQSSWTEWSVLITLLGLPLVTPFS